MRCDAPLDDKKDWTQTFPREKLCPGPSKPSSKSFFFLSLFTITVMAFAIVISPLPNKEPPRRKVSLLEGVEEGIHDR